jgi:hypothetical protein
MGGVYPFESSLCGRIGLAFLVCTTFARGAFGGGWVAVSIEWIIKMPTQSSRHSRFPFDSPFGAIVRQMPDVGEMRRTWSKWYRRWGQSQMAGNDGVGDFSILVDEM